MSFMSQISNNNARIAKNTIFLYFRMILLMAVSLYTSRVVLSTLGIEDYGIYNVVGGIVSMLAFFNGTMSGVTQRYITFAIGERDEEKIQKVFSTALWLHWLIAFVIFIFSETIGLWFVVNKLTIPNDREFATFWVYQFSLLTTIVLVVSIPYNACLIAYEKMSAFAYISITEAIFKLLIVYVISVAGNDKLIVYAALLLFLQLIVRLCYSMYCRRNFPESRAPLRYEKHRLKEMFAYSGWTSLGHLAIVGYTQGLNILLNIFFGPVVNAARGVSVQVQSAVTRFVTNFQMALNPQITKSYAANNLDYMHKLVLYSSKYAFFLMLLLSFPIIINAEYILGLWLGNVPQYTVAFVRLTLVISTIESLKGSVLTSLHATGRIRKVQIIESCSLLMIVPISYLILKSGVAAPESVFGVYLCVELFTQMLRVRFILPLIGLSTSHYLKIVVVPLSLIATILVVLFFFYKPEPDLGSFVYSSLAGDCVIMLLVYIIGLSKSERLFLIQKVRQTLSLKRK